MILLRKML